MSGIELVTRTFSNKEKRAKFMPYFPVGYPDFAGSIDIIESLAKSGADAIEVGMPFSDPIADGKTIQAATQIALQKGVTAPDCIRAIDELRKRGVEIPLLLMGYVNPMLAYGLEDFIKDATEAGTSGFIVPDLPPDEAEDFHALAVKYEAAFPTFLAPTSNEERIKLAGSMGRGFIYLVSVTGVTGAREDVPVDLKEFVSRVRKLVELPLAVGFGIGSPEKAQAVGKIADGVIIGSKFVTLAQESSAAVMKFAEDVRQALDK